ncbi:MAG: PleD family two-component system response regulator [Actinomycetota bacterium]
MDEPLPRILAVDDDEGVLTLYRLGLKEKGYDVYTAADGELAIESIEEETPDAIILDMWMPKASGMSLLKWLRFHEDTRDIPVIAVSSTDKDDELWDGEDLDWDHYLTKPVDIDELADILQETIVSE